MIELEDWSWEGNIIENGWSSEWRFVKWHDFSLMYVRCWKRTGTFSGQILFALFILFVLSSSLFDEVLHWIIILQGECWYLLVDNTGLHWAPCSSQAWQLPCLQCQQPIIFSDVLVSKPIWPPQSNPPTWLQFLGITIMQHALACSKVVSPSRRPVPLTGWQLARHDWHVSGLPERAIARQHVCSDNIEPPCSHHILHSRTFWLLRRFSRGETCSAHPIPPLTHPMRVVLRT